MISGNGQLVDVDLHCTAMSCLSVSFCLFLSICVLAEALSIIAEAAEGMNQRIKELVCNAHNRTHMHTHHTHTHSSLCLCC